MSLTGSCFESAERVMYTQYLRHIFKEQIFALKAWIFNTDFSEFLKRPGWFNVKCQSSYEEERIAQLVNARPSVTHT